MKETLAAFTQMQADLSRALPDWGLSPRAEVSFLSHSENTTFAVADPDADRRLVLRVHRTGYHTADEILSELSWILSVIAGRIIETPCPVPNKSGQLLHLVELDGLARHVVAFEHMSGEAPSEFDNLTTWFKTLGALTARLHLHSRQWIRPSQFRRKTWDFNAMLGCRPLWGDWRAAQGLTDEGERILRATAGLLERRLAAYGQDGGKFGLIHADLRLANLLVDQDRLGIIDFDDCGLSWFFYDFAAAISFMEDQPIVPALQDSWLDGYRTVTNVSADDARMLPTFIMLRRMLLTAWIASHSDTETACALGPAYTDRTIAMADDFLHAPPG